ncbi:uncharacterized protein PHACADRAFT_251089 [Phanerochaete carnosa HHB-10118-sp]|uniref:Uncharacterized protein n=1 Tax=Phanerochaete carnosa (strain HHB-10118-sp) TaxID=650164 RepID=K5V4A2_PHACS|nr:uncharacterized protein PHACADRAFT_251089 [Phanerochaete carnosa HHB-10118-sp]EKM57426.1 hypothetical protein PHACADRAFT_251089 [Phanerochaete carnosa HHB-10118-sp]
MLRARDQPFIPSPGSMSPRTLDEEDSGERWAVCFRVTDGRLYWMHGAHIHVTPSGLY